jgi:hypothetical protein
MKSALRYFRLVMAVAIGAGGLVGAGLLSGCYMTPEDKAFYGRGWVNPDELDVEPPPPRSFTDPTAIEPHPLPPTQ